MSDRLGECLQNTSGEFNSHSTLRKETHMNEILLFLVALYISVFTVCLGAIVIIAIFAILSVISFIIDFKE